MENECVFIKTYGRAGSHLICDWFANLGYKPFDTNYNPKRSIFFYYKFKKVVINDHSINDIPNFTLTKTILLKRKNVVFQALSEIVSKVTKQWVEPYNSVTIQPFFVEESQLLKTIDEIKKTDRKREKVFIKRKLKYDTIFYEDFANNPKFLNQKLEIENTLTEWKRLKSPYQAKDLVLNFDSLKKLESKFL